MALTCYPLVITGHEGYPKAEASLALALLAPVPAGSVPLPLSPCMYLLPMRIFPYYA